CNAASAARRLTRHYILTTTEGGRMNEDTPVQSVSPPYLATCCRTGAIIGTMTEERRALRCLGALSRL
ncbi:MAG: hypothetical protein M3371_12525, partial [Acidobacteriota bacterium]|nr:hypothetical protein [Acidobacteriota bacterium]